MAVTLRDVAERADVSTRTVSNVVNNFHHVSPAMRARVQAALDELNYRPNLLARGLREGRTGIITLLLPQIAVPYFAQLAHEIVERASQLGITVMIDETSGEPRRELALLRVSGHSSWVDGVLLSSQGLRGRELADLRLNVPVVLLGERTANSALDHVGIDNVRAAQDAVRHLVESGRRRIAALGGTNLSSDATSQQRLKGYRAALRAAGLPVGRDLHVRTASYERGDAGPAINCLLDRPDPPDAVFCFSDDLALGSLRALHERGVRVPADMYVVGFDDIEESRFAIPSLTTIRPDRAQIANAALDILLQRIAGSDQKPRDVRVPHHLVCRETTTETSSARRPSGTRAERPAAAAAGAVATSPARRRG